MDASLHEQDVSVGEGIGEKRSRRANCPRLKVKKGAPFCYNECYFSFRKEIFAHTKRRPLTIHAVKEVRLSNARFGFEQILPKSPVSCPSREALNTYRLRTQQK